MPLIDASTLVSLVPSLGGVPPPTLDLLLESASLDIHLHLQRNRLAQASWIDKFDDLGQNHVRLTEWPVDAASLEVTRYGESVDVSEWYFDLVAREIRFRHNPIAIKGNHSLAYQKTPTLHQIQVGYLAGYSPIPASLRLATALHATAIREALATASASVDPARTNASSGIYIPRTTLKSAEWEEQWDATSYNESSGREKDMSKIETRRSTVIRDTVAAMLSPFRRES